MNILSNFKQSFARRDKNLFIFFLIVLIAFIVRLICLNSVLKYDSFLKYPSFVENILSGKPMGERILDFSPFYIVFHIIFSGFLNLNPYWIKFIQLLIGVANCILLFFIGKKMFNAKVGLISCFIYALYGNAILYEGTLEPTVFVMFFNLVMVLVFLRSVGNTLSRFFLHWFGLSCFLGLSITIRPNILLLLVFFVFWIVRTYRRNLARLFTSLAGLSLGICVVVAAMMLVTSSFTKTKMFSLFSVMSPGQVFNQGNNPYSLGIGGAYPASLKNVEICLKNISKKYLKQDKPDYAHQLYRDYARRITGSNLSPADSSKFWLKETFKYIKKYPKEYMKLLLRKSLYFWNSYENHLIGKVYHKESKMARFPFFTFSVIAPLGILGFFLSIKIKKANTIGAAIILIYFINALIFSVRARYRLPAIPMFIVYSGSAIYFLFEEVRRKNIKSFFLLVIVLWGILGVVNLKDEIIQNRRELRQKTILTEQAMTEIGKGNQKKAAILWRKTHKYDLRLMVKEIAVGAILPNILREALRERKRELKQHPKSLRLICELAVLYMNFNRLNEAKNLLLNVIKKKKNYHGIFPLYNPYINLSYIFYKEKNYGSAIKILNEGIKHKMPLKCEIESRYLLGIYYKQAGENQRSNESFNSSKGLAGYISPDPAEYYLLGAYLSTRCRDFLRACEMYRKYHEIIPNDGYERFNYGLCLTKVSKFDDALNQLKLAIKYYPDAEKTAQYCIRIIQDKIRHKKME